jgi:hypothetical protein
MKTLLLTLPVFLVLNACSTKEDDTAAADESFTDSDGGSDDGDDDGDDDGGDDDGDGGGDDSFDIDAAESAHGCNIATVFCMALFGDQFASVSTDDLCAEIDALYEDTLGDFLPSTPVDTCPSGAAGVCGLVPAAGQDQALFFYADSVMDGPGSCSQSGGIWMDL